MLSYDGTNWVNSAASGGGTITVAEEDDVPSVAAVGTIKIPNNMLTDNGDGTVSIAIDGSTIDLTIMGPLGTITPDEGHFTTLVADSFDFGSPPAGETGEIALLEDPVNPGENSVTLKAPANIAADVIFTLPAVYGTAGDTWITDGAGMLSQEANHLTEAEVDAMADNNGYLTAETDPSVDTSPEVVTIINTAPSTLISETVIDAGIARDSELPLPVTAPTTSTDICAAGDWSYDDAYYYLCVTKNIVDAKTDVSFTAATSTITSLTDPIGTNAIVGHSITIAGSTSNDGSYTVASITDANNVVVTEAVIDEAAAATITVQQDSWMRAALASW